MPSVRFPILLLLISSVIGVAGWVFFSEPYSFFYRTIAFLFLGTVGGHFYTIEVRKRASEYFAPLYILITVVKVLIYGAYAFYVIRHDAEQAIPNIVFFLSIYFLFTALEGYFLYWELSNWKDN